MADSTAILLTDEELKDAIKWAKDQLTGDRTKKYEKVRKYYDGDQDLNFATDKFANAFGSLFQTFAYNRCGSVVDAIADRLQLKSLEPVVEEGAEPPEDVAKLSESLFRWNNLDRKQNDQVSETLKTGDAYAIVWLDGVAPDGTVYPTININPPENIIIRYDDEGKKRYAVKAWKLSDGKWRVTLYGQSATYKYITPEKKDDFPAFENLVEFEALDASGVAEPWPILNNTGIVPVFHFNNNAPEGEFGRSELRDVIPLQDALNKACTDLMVAMEYGAYPQRYATGLQLGLPDPVSGKIPSPFKAGPGETWTGPQGATFGSFEVANLEQFTKVQDSFDGKISNVTRIPQYWFQMGSGGNLSGETLKTADAPFVAKLTDRQTGYGSTWKELTSFCFLLMGKEGLQFNAIWKSAELRSDTDKLQEGVLKKQLGWSEEQIMRDYGLDNTTIERMAEEKKAALAEQQAQFSAGLTGAMPAGGGNNPPGFTKRSTDTENETPVA